MWDEKRKQKFMKKIVLYGTGLEGEKFYSRISNPNGISYCIDKRNHRYFHNKYVYSLDEKIDELKECYTVIAATYQTFLEIRDTLIENGLNEFLDFIHSELYEKSKLAIVYGNCHMEKLCEYLRLNYYFSKRYFIRYYYVGEGKAPSDMELKSCDLFLTQDIREENDFKMPGAESLMKRLKPDAIKIVIPNLYGCNLFFMQSYFPDDEQIKRHLQKHAVDMNGYDPISGQRLRVSAESIGKRDQYIDECYKNGRSVEEIKGSILNDDIWDEQSILNNFCTQMEKLKSREEKCDIRISDYIERNYHEKLLFYEPFHPSEEIIAEKGRRILSMLSIPIEEERVLSRTLDAMEMPVYGCVKRALDLHFDQRILRRQCSSTLLNCSETLDDYIHNYIVWVWENR